MKTLYAYLQSVHNPLQKTIKSIPSKIGHVGFLYQFKFWASVLGFPVEVRSQHTAMTLIPDTLNFRDRLIFATIINGNRN
jgi:hypothetical protein